MGTESDKVTRGRYKQIPRERDCNEQIERDEVTSCCNAYIVFIEPQADSSNYNMTAVIGVVVET